MKITETLREDGLHIISCRIPHSKKVRVKLISEVGSAYDPPEKDGHFHYFEHMAFKGTARRTLADIASHRKKNLLSWGHPQAESLRNITANQSQKSFCNYATYYAISTAIRFSLKKN